MKPNEKPLKTRSHSPGFSLALAACLLTGIGILEIYAASSVPALQRYGDPFFFLRKQIFVAAFGFCLVIGMQFMPIAWLKRLTLPLLIASLAFLALIFVPSLQHRAGHAARWLRIGFLSFQPAEVAKLALVLFLARHLSRPTCQIRDFWSGLFPNILVFGLFAMLIMPQPDFGTTVLLFVVTFLMVFVAGIQRKTIILAAATGFCGLALAIAVAPYRLKRLVTFLEPFAQIREGGYQIIQSFVGFQNGGLWGLGLGGSKQKLFFLPEAHTDFILSVIGEELGLVGVLFVAGLFAYIAFTGYSIARAQSDNYQKFLAFGLTSLISVQACLNMGVAMGALPTKGIPLPFVSNGPSCLLVFLVSVGILARLGSNVAQRSIKAQIP